MIHDFRTEGLSPADDESAWTEGGSWGGDLTVLIEHHTASAGRSMSYYAAHDRSVTWIAPESPQVVALFVTRDLAKKTFTMRAAYHASLPFAQAWLMARGCPPAGVEHDNTDFIQHADELTARLEHQILTSGTRYVVLKSWAYDNEPSGTPRENGTLTHDTWADTAPVRVFLEHWTTAGSTYTVREGAFPDEASALAWLDRRIGPLPAAPEPPPEQRAMVARSRSAHSSPEGSPVHAPPPTGTQPTSPGPQR